MEDTIYSLVTKSITQNVAIIRISGNKTFLIVKNLITKKLNTESNSVNNIYNNSKLVDQALFIPFKKPNSFTGEDVVEIQCHGNLFIVSEILSLLNNNGAIQAKPGDFSRRALMNGKLDLFQVEAINSLINSNSIFSKNRSLEDLSGSKKKTLFKLEQSILKIRVHLETNLDYPEYTDIKALSNNEINKELSDLLVQTLRISSISKKVIPLIDGINLAIVGRPNSGKSELLNSLLGMERSIVSSEEGTTRDTVEENVMINDVNFRIIDTAGIRKSDSNVENMGIIRSKKAIEKSEIIIHLIDGTKKTSAEDEEIQNLSKDKIVLKVINKNDLKILDIYKNEIKISAKKSKIKNLINELERVINKLMSKKDIDENLFFINRRQTDLIDKINLLLKEILNEIKLNMPIDIILIKIKEVEEHLKHMSGALLSEKDMQNIFDNFCLGK